MANFRPFKRYIIYCLDRLIDEHGARGPFLDAGCGAGDVSEHLARTRQWQGKAIDLSDAAIDNARERLRAHPGVTVARQALDDEPGTFSAIVMLDVLEHLEDDAGTLRAIAARLAPGGHVFFTVPSNPREWRWDDDVYGHLRRYRLHELAERLEHAGLEVAAAIDVSYPVFWAMRRAFTRVLKRARHPPQSSWERTLASTTVNAWHVPVLGRVLESGDRIWNLMFAAQYRWGRRHVTRGCELMVCARQVGRPFMGRLGNPTGP